MAQPWASSAAAMPRQSSAAMRSLVTTFRTRLEQAGASHDDETVWCLLARLHILVFDFTAESSADETLAREPRCMRTTRPMRERSGPFRSE